MRECAAVSAVVGNLLLCFSPCKNQLLAADILSTLKTWAGCENEDVQRNGLWAFLNVAYKVLGVSFLYERHSYC